MRLRAETRREGVLLLLIVLVLAGFSLIIENYLTARLFNRVSASVAILAILAIGQTLVVLTATSTSRSAPSSDSPPISSASNCPSTTASTRWWRC